MFRYGPDNHFGLDTIKSQFARFLGDTVILDVPLREHLGDTGILDVPSGEHLGDTGILIWLLFVHWSTTYSKKYIVHSFRVRLSRHRIIKLLRIKIVIFTRNIFNVFQEL